ncbi:MAG: DEAD/DEAH box helicase [Clostridia bacterium]|nr:DEAD/DEAH box helicase [Clostridia bacterium]
MFYTWRYWRKWSGAGKKTRAVEEWQRNKNARPPAIADASRDADKGAACLADLGEFAKMGLSAEIIKALEALRFTSATPVQLQTIPEMMAGRDIIAVAPTGTGKTCAFGIPMLEYVNLKDTRIQEAVICPTRELALQIGEDLTDLARYIPQVRIAVLYGGQPIARQITQLKRKPQIVVATPGRILDHMQRGTVNLDHVHTMVLDEADEMLKMGFLKDVTRIVESAPPGKQLVMFSATSNRDVMTIAWKFQQDPLEIIIPATQENRPDITEYVIASTRENKYDELLYLLDANPATRTMIFCNTKSMADRLSRRLIKEGYSCDCLHGDMRQTARNQVMDAYRRAKFDILVATDVAARGIDVDDVETVINYDLPNENEYYLHRIGRTGRAKRRGVSFSLVTFTESVRMDEILKYLTTRPVKLHFNDMGILAADNNLPIFDKT